MMIRPALVVAAVWLVASPQASAQPLDPPTLTVDAFFNLAPPNRISTNVFGTYSLSDPRFGAIGVDASGTPAPLLRAESDIGPNALASIFGRGVATIEYGVEVVGPAGPVGVVVGARGEAVGAATTGASFAVESAWRLFDGLGDLAGDDVRSGQLFATSFDRTFEDAVAVVLVTNRVYAVSMVADAQAAATDASSHALARAFVDPIFTFAPGVDPALYSFRFSAGIGNAVTVVPEPATTALLTTGLLVFAAARRRLRACRP